jgi:hypothetical protein
METLPIGDPGLSGLPIAISDADCCEVSLSNDQPHSKSPRLQHKKSAAGVLR